MQQDPVLTYNEILQVVTRFYQKALEDTIIGYHFRRIDDFSTHLPRIAYFWEIQLLGIDSLRSDSGEKPFQLFAVHKKLQIKRAQVRRWVILFKETLQEVDRKRIKNEDLIRWERKIEFFQEKFLANHSLF